MPSWMAWVQIPSGLIKGKGSASAFNVENVSWIQILIIDLNLNQILCISVCINICIYLYINIFIYVSIYIFTYSYMYLIIYIYISIYVSIYILTY